MTVFRSALPCAQGIHRQWTTKSFAIWLWARPNTILGASKLPVFFGASRSVHTNSMDDCTIYEKRVLIELLLLLLLLVLQWMIRRMVFVIHPGAVAKAKDTVDHGVCWQFANFPTSFSSPALAIRARRDEASPHVQTFSIKTRLPTTCRRMCNPAAAQAAKLSLLGAKVGVATL